ncbi:YjcZ family sporulation protein [Evansella sp. AB-rgal1]|uniref:YjcZ family sporulation protein n=1 Tax=Evansella sp. AB-rgal1 TaxID=3242696 RepID=UPI00359E1BC3
MSGYYTDPAYAAYGCAPTAPVAAPAPTGGFMTGFALVLVLFILLVIIGAAAWTAY